MLMWYDDIFIVTQLKAVFHWSKSRLTGIQTINQDKLIWGDDFAEFSFSSFSLAFRSIWNDPGIWPNIMRLYYLGAFRACNIGYPSALLDFSLFLWFSRAIMLRRRLIHFCAWVESKSCCSHLFGVWTSLSAENVWTKPASDIRLHAGVRNVCHHSLNTSVPQFVVWLFYVACYLSLALTRDCMLYGKIWYQFIGD